MSFASLFNPAPLLSLGLTITLPPLGIISRHLHSACLLNLNIKCVPKHKSVTVNLLNVLVLTVLLFSPFLFFHPVPCLHHLLAWFFLALLTPILHSPLPPQDSLAGSLVWHLSCLLHVQQAKLHGGAPTIFSVERSHSALLPPRASSPKSS